MDSASKIINAMKKVANSNKEPSSQIVSATVTSINPLKFQLENRLEIDSNFYELSNLEDWKNIQIGTKVRAFSYNNGQKYYISEIIENKSYNMASIEKILSGESDIEFNPIGTPLSATTVSGAIKELATGAGGGNNGGTYNYENLENKPKIEGIELIGDKSFQDLNLASLSNSDIENLINSIIL